MVYSTHEGPAAPSHNLEEILTRYYEPDNRRENFQSNRLTTLFQTLFMWPLQPLAQTLTFLWGPEEEDGEDLDLASEDSSLIKIRKLRELTVRQIESATRCPEIEAIRKTVPSWLLSKQECRALLWKKLEETPADYVIDYIGHWPKFWDALSECKWEKQVEIIHLLPRIFLKEALQSSEETFRNERVVALIKRRMAMYDYADFITACETISNHLYHNLKSAIVGDDISRDITKGLEFIRSQSDLRLAVFLNLCLLKYDYDDCSEAKISPYFFERNQIKIDYDELISTLNFALENAIFEDMELLVEQRNSNLITGFVSHLKTAVPLLKETRDAHVASAIIKLVSKLYQDECYPLWIEMMMKLSRRYPEIYLDVLTFLNECNKAHLEKFAILLNLSIFDDNDEAAKNSTFLDIFKELPKFSFIVLKRYIYYESNPNDGSFTSYRDKFRAHYNDQHQNYSELRDYPSKFTPAEIICIQYVCDLVYISPNNSERFLNLIPYVIDTESFHLNLMLLLRDIFGRMRDPENCFCIAQYLFNSDWHTNELDEDDPLIDYLVTFGNYSPDDPFHPYNVWQSHLDNQGHLFTVPEPIYSIFDTTSSLSLSNIQSLTHKFVITLDKIPKDVNLASWKALLIAFECELNGWEEEEVEIVIEEIYEEEGSSDDVAAASNHEGDRLICVSSLMKAYFGSTENFNQQWEDSLGDPLITEWIDSENYPLIVPFYQAQLAAIVHWILTLDVIAPSHLELSPRSAALYALMQSLLWCSEAKRNGIALFYTRLPDEFKYRAEGLDIGDELIIESKQTLALLVQGFLENTINDQRFLRVLTKAPATDLHLVQEVHQITYTLNLIGPSIGLNYGVLFDLHTHTIYRNLLEMKPEEAIRIFLDFATPKKLITHLCAASKKSQQLNQSLINLIPPSNMYWNFNDDLTEISLKPEGAMRLLALEGYITTTEPQCVDYWKPDLFMGPQSPASGAELFEDFTWDQSQNLSRRLQQKRIALDKLCNSVVENPLRLRLYLNWLNQSSHKEELLKQSLDRRQYNSFRIQWPALFIEPLVEKIGCLFATIVEEKLHAHPHISSLVTLYEQSDYLITSLLELVTNFTGRPHIKMKLKAVINQIICQKFEILLERDDLIAALKLTNWYRKNSDALDPQLEALLQKLEEPSFTLRRWNQVKEEFKQYNRDLRTHPFDLSKFTELCRRALLLIPEGDHWIVPGYENFMKLFQEMISAIEAKAPTYHIFEINETKTLYDSLMDRLKLPPMEIVMSQT